MCYLISGIKDGLKPEPNLTVSEWADANRILPRIAAAEHGQWRTSRTPYLKMIMDCLSASSPYKKVVVMKGGQLGFTEAGNNWIGYIIDNAPAPTLMVQPTEETVKRNSKMRIDTMISACPSLFSKVSKQKSRNGENTITQKNFPGGILLMTGANSAVGLRSVPIRFLFLDEIDGYPYDLDGEGSPVDLAIARTSTFARKKIFIISTPTLKGNSAIELEFGNTDQNYYEVPCPYCGQYQRLVFENLKWEPGKIKDVRYQCCGCNELIEERHKTKMLENGQWIAYNPEKTSKETIGFHLSALYSPLGWLSWSDIADQYEKSEKDPAKRVTFTNMVLGESFEESGESPDWETIYNKSRMENNKQNIVPANVCFITVGVDIQKDRIECEIVGWCADRQSYSIDYRVLLGNTTLPDVWSQLADEVIGATWTRADGIEIQPLKVAIDSGYNTTEVYAFCRKFTGNKVIPVKGQDNLGVPVAPPRQIDYNKTGKKIGKLKQWNVGVSMLKGELYQWLRLEPKEDGIYPQCYCHFPQYDGRYFEGLVSEQYMQKTHKWKKVYDRNEPLDTRIYARAAASIVGLDRMKPEQLMKLGAVSVQKSTPASKQNENQEEDSPRERRRRRSSFWD
ncbi:MAG: phage terminase large subunit family protein [Prevotella sp.]|jgi:phage terminase large subunit GpA-like protein|nr:phage terminase large subunit family protein [Prevotella sp.]